MQCVAYSRNQNQRGKHTESPVGDLQVDELLLSFFNGVTRLEQVPYIAKQDSERQDQPTNQATVGQALESLLLLQIDRLTAQVRHVRWRLAYVFELETELQEGDCLAPLVTHLKCVHDAL